jgi:hypothetical protein
MTLMVRDEGDIIAPMIDHHLAQGFDRIIVTDNGSVDGTYEILQSYGDAIVLRQDPVQHKQQHRVVTAMAREAYTKFGADWVVNADADEFWHPTSSGATLRDVFLSIPKSLGTFIVPVIDMTGAPALRGTGLQRLIYRDTRPLQRMHQLGLHAHSTPNAVHIGSETIEVAQGNHAVNLGPNPDLATQWGIEVLHFPWRSWEQFERKVRNSGLAYEKSPDLQPSPNHHGMREYRRWKLGSLLSSYVIRHPVEDELASGGARGDLTLDTRVADSARSPVADVPLDHHSVQAARTYGGIVRGLEDHATRLAEERDERAAELLRYIDEGKQRIDALLAELGAARDTERSMANDLERVTDELTQQKERKVVRFADTVTPRLRAARRRNF